MKIETILNAFEEALDTSSTDRRVRQYRAFRARIIKMFEEKEDFIEWAHEALEYYYDEDLAQREQITEKDAKIAELEATVTELLVISAKERIARLEEAQDV